MSLELELRVKKKNQSTTKNYGKLFSVTAIPSEGAGSWPARHVLTSAPRQFSTRRLAKGWKSEVEWLCVRPP